MEDILSGIEDPNQRVQLQKDIAALSDNALQLYLDSQGKMNVSQTELVKRAIFGDKNGYNITQLVDYYDASDMMSGIKTNQELQGILNEKNTGIFGREKDSYRCENERQQRDDYDKQLANKENPPKDPSALKEQVKTLKNKLALEADIKRLASYVDQFQLGRNPFENAGAYEILVETARTFLEYGGKDATAFKEYLKNSERFNRVKWSSDEVFAKLEQALSEAKNPETPGNFVRPDFLLKISDQNGVTTIYKGTKKYKIENARYYEWDGTDWVDLNVDKEGFEGIIGDKIDNIPSEITNKDPNDPIKSDARITETKMVDGRIVDGNGNGVNYAKPENFVITMDGKFVLGLRHQKLADNKSIQAGGSVIIQNGKVVQIDNLSGHYEPTVAETKTFPNAFRNAGIDVSGATLKIFDFSKPLGALKPAEVIIIP